MSQLNDFLSEAGVFYLATVDGDAPAVRPLGAHIEMDGKVIFGVGTFKEVYRQLVANPKVQIVACKPDGVWLRYSGTAVFDDDPKYAETMISAFGLDKIYNEETGYKMGCFHLENADARIIHMMGEGDPIDC